MWSNILSDNSLGPTHSKNELLKTALKTSFDNEWDVLPAGRKKLLHSQGVVCPFILNIKSSPFTGIFKKGESRGLIRLSPAFPPTEDNPILPGAGVKFFRTGRSSANFVAVFRFRSLSTNNFFSVPLSNNPGDAYVDSNLALQKFCQVTNCTKIVGLSDICKYDQEGNEAKKNVFPFKVSFP